MIGFIFLAIMCLYALTSFILKIKYQKMWDKEKAMRLRVDPAITKAELCEQYVMFCNRNGCKVEF